MEDGQPGGWRRSGFSCALARVMFPRARSGAFDISPGGPARATRVSELQPGGGGYALDGQEGGVVLTCCRSKPRAVERKVQ